MCFVGFFAHLLSKTNDKCLPAFTWRRDIECRGNEVTVASLDGLKTTRHCWGSNIYVGSRDWNWYMHTQKTWGLQSYR